MCGRFCFLTALTYSRSRHFDCSEVAKAFMHPAEMEDGKSKAVVARALNCRHQRHSTKGAQAGWRPRARHRVAARKWLAMKDNMIDVGTHWRGLVDFKFDSSSPCWAEAN